MTRLALAARLGSTADIDLCAPCRAIWFDRYEDLQLSPAVRQNIQTINCSNCGATIDLAKDSVCPHCGSAVSMLDLQHMARTISQLQAAAAAQEPAAADAVTRSATSTHSGQLDVDAMLLALKAEERALSNPDLFEAGLSVLGNLLRKRL